jgi:hypothetical protein
MGGSGNEGGKASGLVVVLTPYEGYTLGIIKSLEPSSTHHNVNVPLLVQHLVLKLKTE